MSFIIRIFTKYYKDDEIRKGEMGTHISMHTKYYSESLQGRDHLEELGVNANIILK
jgi:hypothetical protein